MDSYRKLMFKTSTYASVPEYGEGLRLGIYQAQAAYGPGASAKNMDRLEKVARIAKERGVQLLSFPELYVPGYTLSPKEARKIAESADGTSITRACRIAGELEMAMLVPYAEKAKVDGEIKYYDSIAVISEKGKLVTSYKKTHLYGQQEREDWSFGSNPPSVFKVFDFPVGILNCYENEFPELSRMLALKGAKLIVGPTAADCYYTLPNGNRSAVPYPDVSTLVLPAFAYTNNVFYAYSNRAGYRTVIILYPTAIAVLFHIPTFQLSCFQPLHILIMCSMHIPTVQDMRNEIQTNGTIVATVSLSDLTVTSLFRPIISRTHCLLPTASLGTMG
jgi:predicted amidohydrolase